MLLLLLTLAAAPDTVVVCPPVFRAELAPWVEYREKQGHKLEIVSNEGGREAICGRIRAIAVGGTVKNVVLVGDSEPNLIASREVAARQVPAQIVKAKVNIHFGSEPELATDNCYGDFDGDGMPEAAVGRLSCDTTAELKTIVAKILAYERTAASGLWRRKINFVAGAGDFGPIADGVLEMVTGKFLTEGIPASYVTTMTYGSWRSPYCPDPRRFRDVARERLTEGCLFWCYIGHGAPRNLHGLDTPVMHFPCLRCGDLRSIESSRTEEKAAGSPIALMLACYTSAYDLPEDCLAEDMLRSAAGPVAAIGGSRVTMPYAMGVLGTAMMDETFREHRATLGEVLLAAKRRLVKPTKADEERRQWLDMIAAALSPKPELLAEERAEHVLLFNLLGDPLLRIRQPRETTLTVAKEATAGETLVIEGTSPIGGQCTLELVYRRDRLAILPPNRPKFALDRLEEYSDTYTQANERKLVGETFTIEAGPFKRELRIPAGATGACHILAHIADEEDFALGSADVFVRRKQ